MKNAIVDESLWHVHGIVAQNDGKQPNGYLGFGYVQRHLAAHPALWLNTVLHGQEPAARGVTEVNARPTPRSGLTARAKVLCSPWILAAAALGAIVFVPKAADADFFTLAEERESVQFVVIPRPENSDPRLRPPVKPAPCQTNCVPSDAEIRRFAAIVDKASRAYGVDGALIHAVIFAESTYNPDAVSRAGASGLMQLMPETAKRYGANDILDPEQNINAGVKCLRDLLAQFDGDVQLALAGYNAGPNAVIRAGNRIPPNVETSAYVPKVLDYYERFQARKGLLASQDLKMMTPANLPNVNRPAAAVEELGSAVY